MEHDHVLNINDGHVLFIKEGTASSWFAWN